MSKHKTQIQPARTAAAAYCLGCFLHSVVSTAALYLLGEGIDSALTDLPLAVRCITVHLAFAVLAAPAHGGLQLLAASGKERMAQRQRAAFLSALSRADWRFYITQKEGELVYQGAEQIDQLAGNVWTMLQVVSTLAAVTLTVTLCTLRIHPLFLAVYFLLLPILVWRSLKAADICLTTAEKRQRQNMRFAGVAGEGVANRAAIRLLGASAFFYRHFCAAAQEAAEGETAHQRSILRYTAAERLYCLLGYAAVFVLTLALVTHGRMGFGYVVTVMGYGETLFARMGEINYLKDLHHENGTIRAMLSKVLDAPRPACGSCTHHPDSPLALRFVNAALRYTPEGPLLRYGLSVAAGRHVLLQAPSGGGKSTLFRLALQMVRPDAGQVQVFGQDAALYDPAYLRRIVCYVPQTVFTFSGSVMENLLWSNPAATPQQARQLAAACGLGHLLRQDGPRKIGENGVGLSGGEQQRIALVRALLKTDAEIYLFDEVFSQLDAASEQTALALLRRRLRQKTVIYISHRDGAAAYVDEVIAL